MLAAVRLIRIKTAATFLLTPSLSKAATASLPLCFSEHFWHVSARWVAFKQVSSVVFRACSASAADLAVLTNSTLALNVAFIPQFQVKLRMLKIIPRCFQAFVFHVSDSVAFVETARPVIAVFC